MLSAKITPDDILGAVIYASGLGELTKKDSFMHKTVYRMKEEYPSVFGDFLFDESGISPFSEELDGVLFRLETSGILSSMNPSHSTYIVNTACGELESSYDKLKKVGFEEDIKLCGAVLRDISRE